MNVLQLAGSLPRDPEFRAFVALWMVPPREVDVEIAATFIRTVCEVQSRRELATDTEAQQRFHKFLRRPFLAWCDKQ
ncbi:MAG: hypothetical protein EPN37_19240 [Chitinophagaceae bacterium]|nr:MAG: hypothetical protein EPN37_19240 [Chitinophagaceae bacterium]